MKARLFQMRMTSYRNVRFKFHGTLRRRDQRFRRLVLRAVLISLRHPVFPMWVRRQGGVHTRSIPRYGTTQIRFVTGNGRFFAFCYATMRPCAAGLRRILLRCCSSQDYESAEQSGHGSRRSGPADRPRRSFKLLLIAMAGVSAVATTRLPMPTRPLAASRSVDHVVSRLCAWSLIWIQVTNLLGVVFTLGLFYPWAKVREMRYHLENMSIEAAGGLGGSSRRCRQRDAIAGRGTGRFLRHGFRSVSDCRTLFRGRSSAGAAAT